MTIKFEEAYKKFAVSKNYIKPDYPQLDNWAISTYRSGDYFACLSDGGYTRWVGKRVDGKCVWRVTDRYPKPLEYSGITQEEFEALEI